MTDKGKGKAEPRAGVTQPSTLTYKAEGHEFECLYLTGTTGCEKGG